MKRPQERNFHYNTGTLETIPSQGPDDEIRGNRGSPIRMRDMDPHTSTSYVHHIHHRMLLRILQKESGASRQTTASSTIKTRSSEPDARVSKEPRAREGRCGQGHCSAWATTSYPRGSYRESWRTQENIGRGERGKLGRGSSGAWHHG